MKAFASFCFVLGLSISRTMAQDAAPDQKPTVTVHLAQLHDELQVLRKDLSRTIAALDQVKAAANNNPDLQAPFAEFSRRWTEFDEQTQKVRQYGTAARARAKEHWEAWHQEVENMQSAQLKEKARKRYAVTTRDFEKISEKVADAKEDFAPLAADLRDVHTYLQMDLTRAAVSSLSSSIWKMGSQARSVDRKIEDICDQIEHTMKKLPSR
jgi:hypothetical protein